jgi:hypothetical protein
MSDDENNFISALKKAKIPDEELINAIKLYYKESEKELIAKYGSRH